MSAYFISMSIGGTMTVKIEAASEEDAKVVAAGYFIDDWENAGQLKISDIYIDSIRDEPETPDSLDASIIAKAHGDWSYASDDPYERGDSDES